MIETNKKSDMVTLPEIRALLARMIGTLRMNANHQPPAPIKKTVQGTWSAWQKKRLQPGTPQNHPQPTFLEGVWW